MKPLELNGRLQTACGDKQCGLHATPTSETTAVANSSDDDGAMLKIDGLWVHQGEAEPGVDWDHLISNVREERIVDLLKASLK